jgi:outer membrane protein assembly factor BamA
MRDVTLACFVLAAACAAGVEAVPQQPSAPLQVAAIEVSGARRYTAAEVTRLSGLQPGKPVTAADLEAVIKRMAGTGLFKRLNYRYATAAGRTTVTLEIEEADWTMPVVFDNFVWFKDEELTAALRQNIPSFDGTVPVTEGISELVTRELQQILAAKQIPGRVDFVPQGSLNTGIERFVFRVTDPGPKLCSVAFSGASAIKEAELAAVFGATVGAEYSRQYIVGASRGTLTDMYRRRGYWRARIDPPAATLVQEPACSGASLVLKVDEGAPYTWDRAEWSGNAAIPAADLDPLLGFKAGDVADVSKLDNGLRQLKKAYGKQGYIGQRATYAPRLDDGARKAVFAIKVEEGPQFRTGTIEFPGLAPADAETLAKKWQLRPGDVFDASYPDRFFLEEIRPRLPRTAKPPSIESRVDEPNRVVHVRFVFRN